MSAAATFKNRSSFVGTVLRRMRWATPLLFAVGVVAGAYAVAGAQQTGTELGAKDPVGAPASYITLRSDDLAIGNFTSNGNQLNTYQVDTQSKLSSQITAASGLGVLGNGNTLSASGHILGQNGDQLISVARKANGTSLEVRFPQGGTYDLPNLHAPVTNVPDLFSVAVGDLDKIADANGVNHDEVVVAYANAAPATGPPYIYPIQLAVLNYTTVNVSPYQPLYVTSVTTSLDAYNLWSSTVSDVLAVAIGDFDGDGQNEIAVASLAPTNPTSVELAIFRYKHALLTDTPSLQEVTDTQLKFSGMDADFLPTISLMAGDFQGTGNRAELVLGLENRVTSPSTLQHQNVLQAISVDANLKPTLKGRLVENTYSVSRSQGTITAGRLDGLAGLFKIDQSNGFDLYRREIALVYNERQPVSNDSSAKLDIKAYSVASDLNSFSPLFNGQKLQMPDAGVGAKFDATAGGLPVNANINTPLWSLGIAQLVSGNLPVTLTTIAVGSSLATASSTTFQSAASGTSLASDNQFRPTVQAYDYRGRTVFLGAPVRITIPNVINTDFVLEEPPKQALWCESAQQPGCDNTPQQIVNISRNPATAVSLTNTQGVTFSAKSTDTTALSLGGSIAVSASTSASGNLGLVQAKVSLEGTEKVSYNYDKNKSSYNSSYASRTLSETETTDNDDFISGRAQTLDIWRYRVLGVSSQDQSGNPLNSFDDVILPGPTLAFKASGLDLDWYQPRHENGNILSYPAPANNTFSPPDLGTYQIPCPAGASDCSGGLQTQSGAMIPATQEFISGTSGSIGLDYSNNKGSGNTVTYQHKESDSTDVKLAYSSKFTLFGNNEENAMSVAVNFSHSNSWANAQTSDSTTTSSTGIKILRSAINSAQSYAFYPTVYTTLDGTIKVAHAVAPLGSSLGASFWSTLYGGKPDPALNLPARFVRSGGTTWIPNTLPSRKKMRGFFLMAPTPDPVSRQYNILAQAPTDGDQVRVSAQVYNYSTAQGFSNCLVQFYAIKYNSANNTEIGARQLIGSTTISLPPLGTAPAQIVWNTKGFGPAAGGQDYRIYADLNYNNSINELYPPEDPAKQYAPGLAAGLDPGQNDEGWGLATVMAPAALQSTDYSQSATLSFGPAPLAIVTSTGNLLTQDLSAQAGTTLELTSEVCAGSDSSDPADVVVFDGDPSEGNVIAWKRLYVPNANQCENTYFDWTPTRGQHDLVAAILPNSVLPIEPDNALLTAPSSFPKASLVINVP